jgi:hypothetical protein
LAEKIGHREKREKKKIITTFKLKKFPFLKTYEGAVLFSNILAKLSVCTSRKIFGSRTPSI